MQEKRCTKSHPRKPGECSAITRAWGFGTFTVECYRCGSPVSFSFEKEGTEADLLTASIG